MMLLPHYSLSPQTLSAWGPTGPTFGDPFLEPLTRFLLELCWHFASTLPFGNELQGLHEEPLLFVYFSFFGLFVSSSLATVEAPLLSPSSIPHCLKLLSKPFSFTL